MAASEGITLASSAFIFGTLAVGLFVHPFFMYSKNRDDIRQEGAIKVVGEVLFQHLLLVIVFVLGTSVINLVFTAADFKPEEAIRYFFGNSSSTAMWEHWLSKSVSTGSSSGIPNPESDLMSSFVVVMKYYSLIVFVFCIFIPIAVLWQTVGNITSVGTQQNGQVFYQDYFSSIQSGILTYTAMTVIVLTHCAISSLYVRLYIDGFDFFKMINIAWHQLLFKGS